jgi:hypothetical protein
MKLFTKLFTLSIILFFINTSFIISSAISQKNQNIIKDKDNFEGYIVQFHEESIIGYKNKNSRKNDNLLDESLQTHKDNLIRLHKKAKNEISDIVERINSNKKLFKNEFINIFNGISLNGISKNELNKIENLSYVKKVIPNYKVQINLDKSTSLIGAPNIWNYHDTNGKNIAGDGINIAIIDTGVNYNHPDLKGNYIGGYDFVNNDTDPMDDHGHGTHCAGIALGTGKASNYENIGVAPLANLYSYKVLDNEGIGDLSSVLKSFEKAIQDDIDIISISFGNNEELAFPNSTLSLAADCAVDAGIVVIASAGNDGEKGPISSPACARKVICVGATDDYDNIADFSSRGPVYLENGTCIIKPDIVAPGVSIKSCNLNKGYRVLSGTSMSTPHVAGASALILQENPDLTPEELKNIIKENAVDLGLNKNISGNGRIDICACIEINDRIIIKSPFRVNERENFEVSILDKNKNPIESYVIFLNPYHLPRLKFGGAIIFNAPKIINPLKIELKSEIIIVNLKKQIFKKYDITVTNNILITH